MVEIYKSLRELEKSCIEALRSVSALPQGYSSRIPLSNFYGIELDEEAYELSRYVFKEAVLGCDTDAGLPARDVKVDDFTGIHCGDAALTDWSSIVSPDDLSYIVGNPPYLGAGYRSPAQKEAMSLVFSGIKGAGILDFAAIWVFKSLLFCKGRACKCAFILPEVSVFKSKAAQLLFERALSLKGVRCKILFAHKPFKWYSEGYSAGVQVTAIGFDCKPRPGQRALYYDEGRFEEVDNINFYLLKAPNIFIHPRETPLFEYIYIHEANKKPVDTMRSGLKTVFSPRGLGVGYDTGRGI